MEGWLTNGAERDLIFLTHLSNAPSTRPRRSRVVLSPRILELRGLAAAVGNAPSSDRTLREAFDLYLRATN